MLRVEARNAATPIEKKPEWIKTRATMGPEYSELKGLVKREGLHTVCEEAGCPNILETVPRIFKQIRPGFRYDRSLSVLTAAGAAGLVTKSNLILGMGETLDEAKAALVDLHDAGCDLITITQYLRPSVRHHPVDRWVKPEEFVELSDEAERIGFLGVMSGPLVRSSYRAGRLWGQAMRRRGEEIPAALAHLGE